MLKRLLGEKINKNRIFALSHMFMAELYEKEERHAESQAEYRLAEQVFNNIYSAKKFAIADMSELYTKIALSNSKLNEPVTAQKYLAKLREEFGYNHPNTIKVTEYFIKNDLPVGY
jgi:hypothetical protein